MMTKLVTASAANAAGRHRRANHCGTLVKKRGKWAMRWTTPDGFVHQETTPFLVNVKADRKRALELLEERTALFQLRDERDQLAVLIARKESLEAKIKRLDDAATPKEKPLALGELEEAWRNSPRRRDCRDIQLERYAQQVRAFVKWAGRHLDIRLVDDAFAERYAAYLAKRLAPNTYNKHLVVLTSVWKAVGKSRGLANPWEDLPRKRKDTHIRRILTSEEIKAIIDAAEGEYKAIMLIGSRTGLRLGDACSVRWSDFDKDGVLRVKTSKTGALVALPAAQLKAELEALLLPKSEEGLITPALAERHGRDPGGVCANIRKIFDRAGIRTQAHKAGWLRARSDASFHSLRHTFVTNLRLAGVPDTIIRAMVGHSSVAMTDHYSLSHISEKDILAALSKAGFGDK